MPKYKNAKDARSVPPAPFRVEHIAGPLLILLTGLLLSSVAFLVKDIGMQS